MSLLKILNARFRVKRTSETGVSPTVAPSEDFLDGTWTTEDVYDGEFFANSTDGLLWINIGGTIYPVQLGVDGGGGSNGVSVTGVIAGGGGVITAAHNLNLAIPTAMIVQVVNSAGEMVLADKVDNFTANTVDVTLFKADTYRVNMIKI